MATIIRFNRQISVNSEADIPSRFKSIIENHRKGHIEPLTPEKLRRRPGLEKITDIEALETIDTIKKLAVLFFEIACLSKPTCIENQHIVHLNQENKAA